MISRFFLCLQVQGTIHANRCTVEVDEKNPACSLIPLTIPQQVCHPPYEAKTVYVPVIPDPYKHDQKFWTTEVKPQPNIFFWIHFFRKTEIADSQYKKTK